MFFSITLQFITKLGGTQVTSSATVPARVISLSGSLREDLSCRKVNKQKNSPCREHALLSAHIVSWRITKATASMELDGDSEREREKE